MIIAGKDDLFLLNDVSDIRKEDSVMMENLGKIRDLKNNIINGFTSFNSVLVDIQIKSLTLLEVQIQAQLMQPKIPPGLLLSVANLNY